MRTNGATPEAIGRWRPASATERTQAESDRETSLADRDVSATERESASVDGLTGVYLRAPGLVELQREIDRAQRTGQQLALAFVDVDGLKAVNDASGHAAGDNLLRAVADELRSKLRSYDRIIRYGGDEFVCALPGLSVAHALKRFQLVNAALANRTEPGSVSVGFATYEHGDTLAGFIARSDAALYTERRRRRTARQ